MNTNNNADLEISLKSVEGYSFFKYHEIIRFQADGRNTLVYEINKDKPQTVFHKFGEVEEKIKQEVDFYKCHRSHIVNIHHLKHFCTKGYLLITQKGEVPISKTYLKKFRERFCK